MRMVPESRNSCFCHWLKEQGEESLLSASQNHTVTELIQKDSGIKNWSSGLKPTNKKWNKAILLNSERQDV
jgi:hypothetical protein